MSSTRSKAGQTKSAKYSLTLPVADSGQSAPAPARAQSGRLSAPAVAQTGATAGLAVRAAPRAPATPGYPRSQPARTAAPVPPLAAAPATQTRRSLLVRQRTP